MNTVFEQIYSKIWEELFPGTTPPDTAVFKDLFTKDLQLPVRFITAQTGTPVYSGTEYGYKKFISREEIEKHMNKDNFMIPKKDIQDLPALLNVMKDLSLFRGSRSLNSDIIEESDDIYSSSYILNSTHIYSSQKLLWCFNTKTSEYLMASKGNADCAFGIRIIDSSAVSNSFDAHWCAKCANTYFSADCYDLRDCMFCFHIVSKQYCIANMQFTEEEYKKMKEKLLKEYCNQLTKPGAFISVGQL